MPVTVTVSHGHQCRGGMAEAPALMAKEIASDRASKRTKSLEMIGHDRTSLGPIFNTQITQGVRTLAELSYKHITQSDKRRASKVKYFFASASTMSSTCMLRMHDDSPAKQSLCRE